MSPHEQELVMDSASMNGS